VIVTVEAGAAAAIAKGHPWVYRDAVIGARGANETGAFVRVANKAGEPLGVALYDAKSAIALRMFGRDPKGALDEMLIAQRADAAFRRRSFSADVTSAYRLLHGEGDRVPGLTIDRYEHVAVLRSDGDAMASWVDRLVKPLSVALGRLGVRSLVGRIDAGSNERKIKALWGEAAPDSLDVRENGMVMEVDLAFGQKTGAFLDQRDNRLRVRQMSQGKGRVLNLFSYAGGFSLAAALGGASQVISVDNAPRAHGTAQRSFRKNGIDPKPHQFVTADAFTYLEEAKRRGERFDLVISDPPSFAPNEKSKKKALSAYAKLHRACSDVLAEGGLMCASSCSSHIGMEEFLGTVDDAALGRGDRVLIGAFGSPADHPSLAAFPEGRYLKFCVFG
jgi:23S rRNA (cytosine1962-C5)-methyltransferase